MRGGLFHTVLLCTTLLFFASDVLAGVSGKDAPSKDSQEAAATLKAFYTAYAANVAGAWNEAGEKQLFDRYLTDALVRKVRQVGERDNYDLLIWAQDFNSKAVETIAVSHIDGDWYAIGYLDIYHNVCVLIPVKMVKVDGEFRLDDVKPAP